jgi:hypothetical protein
MVGDPSNGGGGDPSLGEWRRSRYGHPLLVRLARLELELGDREAAVVEPATPPPEPTPETSEGWWQHAYAGGPMVKVPGFPRPLYPPDATAQGKAASSDGPDVIAYKRTVCRLERWDPWDPSAWDDSYSNAFAHGRGTGMVGDSGVAGVQRQQGMSDTGWIGEPTFNLLRSARCPPGPHEGEMAMDSVAVNLLEDAWQRFAGAPAGGLDDVEAAILDYCLGCIGNEPEWHYSQARPMTHLGAPPSSEESADCSGHSTSAYYWARQQTGVAVPDPNHSGYNGYGYTGTLVDNPRCSSPYKIGDLAIYGDSTGSTEHVVTCYAAGDASSAEWCSHGSEAAPYAVELRYRSDLLCVVRPGLLPE